jgi:hypothetical protein
MKKFLTIAAGLIAGTTALMTATPALARAEVNVHIGAPARPIQVAPIYRAPRPVHVQPRPVYRDYSHRYARPVRYSRRDLDGDGVPNRFDARPRNPYRY